MTNKTHLKTTLAILVSFVALSFFGTAQARITYVDADATGADIGTSWADAYNYLQDALDAVGSDDEIRVAEGTYKPDQGDGITPGNREATFQLISGVVIKGGYPGFGQPDPNGRDIELYETILSGDLLGDDGPDFANNGENSYHVVTGSGTDETAVLNGFTIAGGNANGAWQDHQNDGGGMYNHGSKPTLANCTFSGNSAEVGGGMANYYSSPTVTNCMFSGNLAIFGGGMYNRESSPILTNCTFSKNFATINHGGGIYNCDSSSPTLTNCTFSGNSARTGAGIMNLRSNPTLTDCTFSGNSASQYGGGMENNDNSNSTLINCTFRGNSASNRGGGMYNCRDSSPILTNCTFSGNTAKLGGGMYTRRGSPIMTNCTFSGNTAFRFDEVGEGGGIYNSYNGNPILTNCILYNNNDEAGTVEFSQMHNTTYASAVVNFSCIQGWTGNLGGTGNIGDDPLFLDADGADNLIGTEDDNLRLLPGSPCIDAGDNSSVPPSVLTDLDGDPRIANGTVDMGAYEGPTQGFLLNTQSLTVPEDQTATFTVALAMNPLGTVQVTVTHVS
ncbi:MAG: right-handed parallel beta-helix repeat-containing protein, partial [Planctomycetota bacterium]